jgi:hypothetical protein
MTYKVEKLEVAIFILGKGKTDIFMMERKF